LLGKRCELLFFGKTRPWWKAREFEESVCLFGALLNESTLADPSSTMACHQRAVFLGEEFTKLSLLLLTANEGVHVAFVPKT
jgi:hypothetical protein